MLSVTFHGGNVLPNVEIQALYYGQDWHNDPALVRRQIDLDGFLGTIVNSPYMDMLTNAGYGVGRGTFDGTKIIMTNPDKSQPLYDSQIRSDLLNVIRQPGVIQQPDANRLYVIFVEPNVAVRIDTGILWPAMMTQGDSRYFPGYHETFSGNVGGTNRDIRYAVVTTPGGAVGNTSVSWLSTFETMTLAASREIVGAATDPAINYKTARYHQTGGWYDDVDSAEIGDISNWSTAYVQGYAMQRIVDKIDQSMTPANATAFRPVSFVLTKPTIQLSGGFVPSELYERTSDGSLLDVISAVHSISDQGIDNRGRAMIDVVMNNGDAYEYHDGGTWRFLSHNVTDAKAGQGESFVIVNGGYVWEYKDESANPDDPQLQELDSWWHLKDGATAIDAGTDRYGVNAVVGLYGTDNQAWEWSDSTGLNHIADYVAQASAGRQGVVDLVFTNGDAYWWQAYLGGVQGGQLGYFSSGVSQVTTGFDRNGNYVIDELFSNGDVYEYRTDRGWSYLDYNVRSLSKSRAGIVDTVSNANNAWEFDDSGNYFLLMSWAKQAT